MSYLKPIISTFAIDNEPSKPHLKEYGHALFVDDRTDDKVTAISEICNFIEKYKLKSIPSHSCKNKFRSNRPEAFVELLHDCFGEERGA